ncbi:MAG: hypothetical protein ACKVE3_03970 [Dissulfuribacterales bacterium]
MPDLLLFNPWWENPEASNQIDIFLPISQGHNKDDIARHCNMDVPSFPSFKDLIPRLLGNQAFIKTWP